MKKFIWNGSTIELDSNDFQVIEWSKYMNGDWYPYIRFTGFCKVVDKMNNPLIYFYFDSKTEETEEIKEIK